MILSIETSAEPASISITSSEGTSSRSFPNQNKVNIPLAEQISTLLNGQKNTISLIIVGAGPGSYSGARVGLATAEAIALTHQCPVITVPSYFGTPHKNTPYAVIGDARRGAYFIMRTMTEATNSSKTPSINLTVLEKEDFLQEVQNIQNSHTLFTYEEPEKLPLTQVAIEKVSSTAEALIHFWNASTKDAQDSLLKQKKEILYLRPPNITKAKNPFA